MDKSKREIFLIAAGIILAIGLVIFSAWEIGFVARNLTGALSSEVEGSEPIKFDIKKFEDLQIAPQFNPNI